MGDQMVLVDVFDRQVGTAEKLECHKLGLLHRAFSLFLVDSKGRILLQKRALGKYHSGGLWTNTCCSHPREGEDVRQAAARRVNREMGISGIRASDLREIGSFVYRHDFRPEGGTVIEFELDHVLLGFWEGECSPNPEEVSQTAWVSQDELARLLTVEPERFTTWLFTAAPMALRELRKERDAQ
ncbi:MAG: isopentenyl-diphosphate Delta-isomerase [Tractidigestivibacter sp.]|jgi:isopentenyl-diphosphate delta-isomerase|uniref:isopentenyl-diphosphate Delta-isomerase n=1 Tax=Tractidigestivibacter sp. TaxID=2847320 RepID=UPI003D90B225